jgi:hypothetical protein
MQVTLVTHWKGGRQEQIEAIARKARAILTRHGATNAQVGRVYSGPETAQWVGVVSFPDWATFGRAQQELATDPEYQALYAELTGIAELTARRIVVGVDL